MFERIDRESLYEGLVQHNYFPTQKNKENEIPPIINSNSFTMDVTNEICEYSPRGIGYDQIEYRVTRFNNVTRVLSIPHPIPYAMLCNEIFTHWNRINYISGSDNSLITPELHSDGRIIIMDYESSKEKIERHIEKSFNNKFYANTDISNFFPSVYTHSIPWALVGFDTAKSNRDGNLWFNKIDRFQRLIKRCETNGIPIGPASSNILSEAILVRIDEALSREDFNFYRFIDDYTGYFNTYEDAESFIRRLSEELAKYKLLLNAKKTIIGQLPCPTTTDWIVDLNTRLPNPNNLYPTNIIRFLDYAVKMHQLCPDGSVIKYAAVSIISLLTNNNDNHSGDLSNLIILVLKYLLGLCIKHPVVIPLLGKLFNIVSNGGEFIYNEQIINILKNHVINKRSDAMSWLLYYLNLYQQEIPMDVAREIIETDDCVSILILYLSGQYEQEIIDFSENKIDTDLFLIDQYWLLFYQLFFDSKINNPYSGFDYDDSMSFDYMKENGISFVSQ